MPGPDPRAFCLVGKAGQSMRNWAASVLRQAPTKITDYL